MQNSSWKAYHEAIHVEQARDEDEEAKQFDQIARGKEGCSFPLLFAPHSAVVLNISEIEMGKHSTSLHLHDTSLKLADLSARYSKSSKLCILSSILGSIRRLEPDYQIEVPRESFMKYPFLPFPEVNCIWAFLCVKGSNIPLRRSADINTSP